MPQYWPPEESRRLMTIVLDVRPPGNPTAIDWEHVVVMYNAQSSVRCDKAQATNHYSSCRYKWLAWKEMSEMTGIALNDGLSSNEELQSERLKQFIQKHKAGGAGKYVTKFKLYDLDLWCPIFGGRCATGEKTYSPALAKCQSMFEKEKHIEKKRPLVGGEEGYGDSDDSVEEIGGTQFGVDDANESVSPPKTLSFKRQRQSASSVSKGRRSSDFDKAFEILKMADSQESHEKKVYQAVKKMEQVRMRGPDFQGKCIYYLLGKKLDKMFLEFETDAEKWAWLKVLDNEPV